MVAAQCTAKNQKVLLGNESGNMLIVISIILMIVGAIGYFISITDRVDTEVRSLGATQRTVYLKPDIQETIRKTLMGTNPECNSSENPTLFATLKKTFIDFKTTIDDAKYQYKWNRTTTALTSIQEVRCFFHPSRYTGVEFESVKIDMIRASEPNFINLSSFVTVSVNIGFTSAGKKSQLKYSLRYRVDALSLNHFGLIFYDSGQLVTQAQDSSVKVNSWVLVDQSNRSSKILLSKFLDENNLEKLKFNRNFWIAAPGLTTDPHSLDFLKNKRLSNTFAYGIEYGVLPTENTFKAPYEIRPTQWQDVFNYDYMDKMYSIPKLDSGTSAIKSPTAFSAQFDKLDDMATDYDWVGNHNDTSKIFPLLYTKKEDVFRTCSAAAIETGQFNVLVFNNLTADFTIDFTGNTTDATPPIFCGFVAARNLIIKLNDKETDDLKTNYLIGKFILNGTIKVFNKGELQIYDVMSVAGEDIKYGIQDLENVKIQFYNWKYYSTQNFQIPFFKTSSIYDSPGVDDIYYIPRATKDYFEKDCSPFKCRNDNIDVPVETKIIDSHKNDLLYEVFIVE